MRQQRKKKDIIDERCDHDYYSTSTSLLFVNDIMLCVYPPRRYGICQYCTRSFTFVKNEDGRWMDTDSEKGGQ